MPGPLVGRLILVVEDEPLVALDVLRGLEAAGARVISARTLVALVGLIRRRRSEKRDPALAERLFQRLKRYAGVVRPLVGRAVAQGHVVVADPLHIGDRRIVRRRKA